MNDIAGFEPFAATSSTDVAEPATPAAPSTDCPRCKKKLLDPAGMGWCSACGYCRSLESNVVHVEEEQQPNAKPRAATMWQLVRDMPGCLRILLVGVGVIVTCVIVVDMKLMPDSRERAICGLATVCGALAIIVLAHLVAARQVSGDQVRLHARGAYSLGGLWRASIAHLPRTTIPVCLLAWGFTILLTGVFVIGGLGWWINNHKFVEDKPRPSVRQQ